MLARWLAGILRTSRREQAARHRRVVGWVPERDVPEQIAGRHRRYRSRNRKAFVEQLLATFAGTAREDPNRPSREPLVEQQRYHRFEAQIFDTRHLEDLQVGLAIPIQQAKYARLWPVTVAQEAFERAIVVTSGDRLREG